MRLRFSFALLFALMVSACGPWPDVPVAAGSTNKGSKYPLFAPLDKARLPTAEQQADEREAEEALDARIARLRARASQLRNTTVQ